MKITYNSHTAQECLDILRTDADFIDENIMVIESDDLKVRLNRIEEAVRAIKFFAGLK